MEPISQDRPTFPQAPDNVVVDPLRLRYNGELNFSPCDHLLDGARHLYDTTQDPLSRRVLELADIGNNSPIKMLPNLAVIMKMCHDLSGQCELTPQDDKDPLLDPAIEFEDFDLDAYDVNSVFAGVSVGRLRILGVSAYLMHFTSPLLTWQQFGTVQRQTNEGLRVTEPSANPPMATKMVLECSQVPGVMGVSMMAPYSMVLFVPKLWLGRIVQIQRDVRVTALRVFRQCVETRLREESQSKKHEL